jgi:hypothetical protein
MGQILHGNATTTEAVRRAIQNSRAAFEANRCGTAMPVHQANNYAPAEIAHALTSLAASVSHP